MTSKKRAKIFMAIIVQIFFAGPVLSIVPEYKVDENGVHIKGIDGTNPIIYDNDWWSDIFDNNYLWAQASLGKADLRANIVTRDMWNHPNYQYSMKRCIEDAQKALKLARDSGLRNIPDVTIGSERILSAPKSRKIQDTKAYPSPGSKTIIKEALRASPQKPLVVIVGGPLTTVANALLTNPEISRNMVVFVISTSYYGYNGKDGWSVYITAKTTQLIEWATRSFWDKNSVFPPRDFQNLPDNPFCNDMRRLIKSDLGQVNQLGDGAPLVWMFRNICWKDAIVRRAVYQPPATHFVIGEPADVLDIPKDKTDLAAMRKEFFSVITNSKVYKP